ncbi:hypothetical protein [Nocardia sp. NBC_00416]|uniref:hypothetical protein n=1 Tax=Nocardia sp. NBC_00416 TaxID=2975991 RepID=UPI002E24BFF6
MYRPLLLLSAALIAVLPGVTACQSDTGTPETAATTTSAATNPDAAQLDQVKAGSFVIGFRGAFPGLAEGRDDPAITAIFTETCADIRAGTPEDEVTTALTDRLTVGDTEPTPPETAAVQQMVTVMCQG